MGPIPACIRPAGAVGTLGAMGRKPTRVPASVEACARRRAGQGPRDPAAGGAGLPRAGAGQASARNPDPGDRTARTALSDGGRGHRRSVRRGCGDTRGRHWRRGRDRRGRDRRVRVGDGDACLRSPRYTACRSATPRCAAPSSSPCCWGRVRRWPSKGPQAARRIGPRSSAEIRRERSPGSTPVGAPGPHPVRGEAGGVAGGSRAAAGDRRGHRRAGQRGAGPRGDRDGAPGVRSGAGRIPGASGDRSRPAAPPGSPRQAIR